MHHWLIFLFILLAPASVAAQPSNGFKKAMKAMPGLEVLLVSDHTLPAHLNEASGGANGEERIFIDPTLARLNTRLIELGLTTWILNVEDMVQDKSIKDKATFDLAYNRYDTVLQEAVRRGVTIVALHYDADIIAAQDYGKNSAYNSASEDGHAYGYVGGIQIILDQRSTSPATLRLADRLINRDRILAALHATGLRYRPDYDDEVRFQNNQTLHISGRSAGGGFLLEIGPQDQAVQLFGTPAKTVEAIDAALSKLALSIKCFRWSEKLPKAANANGKC